MNASPPVRDGLLRPHEGVNEGLAREKIEGGQRDELAFAICQPGHFAVDHNSSATIIRAARRERHGILAWTGASLGGVVSVPFERLFVVAEGEQALEYGGLACW